MKNGLEIIAPDGSEIRHSPQEIEAAMREKRRREQAAKNLGITFTFYKFIEELIEEHNNLKERLSILEKQMN